MGDDGTVSCRAAAALFRDEAAGVLKWDAGSLVEE